MTLLKDASIVQRFSDGEVIISEGITSNNAYIVLQGKVRVTNLTARPWCSARSRKAIFLVRWG